MFDEKRIFDGMKGDEGISQRQLDSINLEKKLQIERAYLDQLFESAQEAIVLADKEGNDFITDLFPAGSREIFVEQGALLGYTGNYNGNSPRGLWVHLHFSIVKDDGAGGYLNELEFENTLDPSPYLGMAVSDACDLPRSGCGTIDSCL